MDTSRLHKCFGEFETSILFNTFKPKKHQSNQRLAINHVSHNGTLHERPREALEWTQDRAECQQGSGGVDTGTEARVPHSTANAAGRVSRESFWDAVTRADSALEVQARQPERAPREA